jgi:hypothetical protein
MSATTVTDEAVQRALALEREREQERAREFDRVKKLQPEMYFEEVAKAQDERFRARIERAEREGEARQAAMESTRGERDALEMQAQAIDAAQSRRMAQIDRERSDEMQRFEAQRRPVRAALAALAQEVDLEAKQVPPVKRGIFGRKREAVK